MPNYDNINSNITTTLPQQKIDKLQMKKKTKKKTKIEYKTTKVVML